MDVGTDADWEEGAKVLVFFSTIPFVCDFGQGSEIWVPVSLHKGRTK